MNINISEADQGMSIVELTGTTKSDLFRIKYLYSVIFTEIKPSFDYKMRCVFKPLALDSEGHRNRVVIRIDANCDTERKLYGEYIKSLLLDTSRIENFEISLIDQSVARK